jgi:fucose 4-O-acetylase-like acetyltransferase
VAGQDNRLDFLDISKGILIVLVVFGHVWRAVYNNSILHNEILYHRVDNWIYSFHMPAFFFLAGIFAVKSADNSSITSFIGNKIRKILYPYLLWATLQTSLQIAMTGSTTSTLTTKDLLLIPFAPVMQFWFLYALFFFFVIFVLVWNFYKSKVLAWGIGVCFVALFQYGYLPNLPIFVFAGQYYIYFATGVLFSDCILAIDIERQILLGRISVFAAAGFFLTVSQFFLNDLLIEGFPDLLLRLFSSFSGVVMILAGALSLSSHSLAVTSIIAYLGRHSMEIFVAHVIFLAGFRIVLFKLFSIDDVFFHLAGATLVGIVGPLCLIVLAGRLRIQYLFIAPKITFPKR